MTVSDLSSALEALPRTDRMPALFIGHGSPMNAVEKNIYTDAWRSLGQALPKPRAILALSAHWLTEGTFIHVAERPRTIHDFWGFPEELSRITYACPGSPEAARATRAAVRSAAVAEDREWGLDHGTWVPLLAMVPDATIPVYQLSLDVARSSEGFYALGAELAALRERGVLILGSGNLVHNLGRINWASDAKAYDWAEEFDQHAQALIQNRDFAPLIAHEKLGRAAELAIPTPDHYWPLLSILGASTANDAVSFPVEGIALGSISMRAVLFR